MREFSRVLRPVPGVYCGRFAPTDRRKALKKTVRILAIKHTLLLIGGVGLLLGGCGGKEEAPPLKEVSLEETYRETGDLGALKKRGQLRILVQRYGESYLPRSGYPLDRERELAAEFAREAGLEPVVVAVEEFTDLIPKLLEGKGDLIAANLTVLDSRKKKIDFTIPVGRTTETIVYRAGEPPVDDLKNLSGRTIAVQEGTAFMETARYIRNRFPDVKVQVIPGDLTQDDILDRMASGEYDLTIEDSNILEVALAYRDDVKAGVAVSRESPLAWGVRRDNPELLAALNDFLHKEQIGGERQPRYKEDLPGLKKRKALRVLTVNNAGTYFIWRGELMGFEYDLAREFAKRQGLRVEVVVAPRYADLIPWLLEGRGDVVAALMTKTEERSKRVAFSRPYSYALETVVARADEKGLEKIEDLKGRTIVVREGSSYWQTISKLNEAGSDFKLTAAPAEMQTEELIAKVADGTFDLTVADSNLLDIELTWRDDVKEAFPLSEKKVSHCWAVRKEDRKLLAAVDAFFDKKYRGVFYNLTYRKYFKDPKDISTFREERIDLNPNGTISPFDRLVKRFAGKYDFHWPLIVSQMYQESRFDPKAVSWAGAKGLMQVMPKTAKEMGFKSLQDPATGLHAGVKYLDWTRDRFDPSLHPGDRTWFALAAYNAGAGHVFDAIKLARSLGLDPDAWFDNVEKTILLLSKPAYHKKARYGYVRGEEVSNYVRQIRDRYRAYATLVKKVEEPAK